MNLRIIKAGVLDTVQDLGRYGWQWLGINPGGVMDKYAAQMANVLVGNDPGAAVIELHFPCSEFFFEQPALIAICGADFSPHINGDEIECGQPVLLSKYSILQFHGIKKGARAYLAVYGGLNLSPWLNSNSTHIKAVAGGFQGRPLQKDDEIPLRCQRDFAFQLHKKEFSILPWKTEAVAEDLPEQELLVLPGHEWKYLTGVSKERFLNDAFTISTQSDRMGYRLTGEPSGFEGPDEILSSVVSFGTIQRLPNGQLIVLMADHQTTGGYPRIAHVIAAHQGKLAQMMPGQSIRFILTSLQKAEELLIKQSQQLQQLRNACKFKLEEYLSRNA